MSQILQSRILHIASSVFVDTDEFSLIRFIVLVPTVYGLPLFRNVYVVAFFLFMVSHNGSNEIIIYKYPLVFIYIMPYNIYKAL